MVNATVRPKRNENRKKGENGKKGGKWECVQKFTHLKIVLTFTTRAALSHSSHAMRCMRGTMRASVL